MISVYYGENNKISVATEHLASAIVEAILNELYAIIASKKNINKKVIACCVENEFHQIGIKMINDVFEMNNWKAHFLGSNLPTKDLIKFIDIVKPNLLAISLSIYFHLPILDTMLSRIREEFKDLPIIIGGQAFQHGGEEILKSHNNVIYLPQH